MNKKITKPMPEEKPKIFRPLDETDTAPVPPITDENVGEQLGKVTTALYGFHLAYEAEEKPEDLIVEPDVNATPLNDTIASETPQKDA